MAKVFGDVQEGFKMMVVGGEETSFVPKARVTVENLDLKAPAS